MHRIESERGSAKEGHNGPMSASPDVIHLNANIASLLFSLTLRGICNLRFCVDVDHRPSKGANCRWLDASRAEYC